MRPIFIVGAGGHARDLAEVAAALDYRPVFVVPDSMDPGAFPDGQESVSESEAITASGEHFAIGIGDNRKRADVAARYGYSLTFPSLVHPDTTLARGMAEMLSGCRGTVVFPGVRIMGHCSVGDFCVFNLNATVSHDCRIADFATLAPGSHIAGNVHVGEGAWLGMGVVVNQGSDQTPRRIGMWSTVGSGAAVVGDVAELTTQVGVPAKDLSR